MNKVVALDIDGVFSNFHFSFSEVANHLFGTPIVEDIKDVKAYRWEDWHPLTKKQCNKVWDYIDTEVVNFWLSARPLVSSSIFKRLKGLELSNHSLYFVTTRQNTAGASVLHQTTQWIKNLAGIDNFSVISTRNKGKIVEGIDAKFFIDDMPENIIEVANAVPNCMCYLLVRSYNNYFIDFITKSHKYKNVDLVYSVDEFIDIVERG